MRVALETYQSAGKHLADAQALLKDESFYRKHTVLCVCVWREGGGGGGGGGGRRVLSEKGVPAPIIPVPSLTSPHAGVCVL